MTEARPQGIALVLLVLFGLFMTAGTAVFVGFAALMFYGIFALEAEEDTAGKTAAFVIALISAFIGSAFAMVAAAVWRAVIGSRGHSHA